MIETIKEYIISLSLAIVFVIVFLWKGAAKDRKKYRKL